MHQDLNLGIGYQAMGYWKLAISDVILPAILDNISRIGISIVKLLVIISYTSKSVTIFMIRVVIVRYLIGMY